MESQDLLLSICGSELTLFPPYFGYSSWEYMRSSILYFFSIPSQLPLALPSLLPLLPATLVNHSFPPSPISTLSPATSAGSKVEKASGLGRGGSSQEEGKGKIS